MNGPAVKSILADTIRFCRALRENGIAVTRRKQLPRSEHCV
jgi:hypothetical protein